MTDRRSRWRWLFAPLALASMMWAGWLLWDSLPSLSKSIPRLRIGWLSLALIGVPISSYLAFEGFHTLFREMRQNLYKRTTLAHLYFTGQLMKHLPGRVWGIAYQSGTGTSATLAEWISVNATYMALTTAFAIWISITVVGTMLHWWLGLALLGTGSVIYAYCWHPRPINAALDLARRIPSRAVARLCDALRPFATASARLKGEVWAWLTASWLVYLLAWSAYGVAWPGLTAVDGIWLCGIYTAAWFVGYISLITPSGIGVRELMFVLMASHFPSDAVAGLAVLGRISLLIADISLGLIFAPYRVRS